MDPVWVIVWWGDELIPRFSHAVFLFLQPHLRQQRLRLRERQRHGDRILPGQDMYEIHTEFMAWAARYDSAGLEQRSRRYTNNGRRSCLVRCCSLIAISR